MSDKTVIPGPLAKKLAGILSLTGKVEKRGYNAHFKYNYVTESDLVYAVRDLLAQNNVFIFTSVEKQESVIDTQTGKFPKRITTVELLHTFVDGETGDTFSVRSQGMGEGTDDKGTYKAITGAMKYFLYKNFLIPTEDDPERDEGGGQREERGGKRAAGTSGGAGGQAEGGRAGSGTGSGAAGSKPKTDYKRVKLPGNITWRDVVIHLQASQACGKKLGELTASQLDAFAEQWQPKGHPQSGHVGPDDTILRSALDDYLDEKKKTAGKKA